MSGTRYRVRGAGWEALVGLLRPSQPYRHGRTVRAWSRAYLVPCTLCLLAGCSTIRLDAALGARSDVPPAVPIERVWERDVQGAFGPSAAFVSERFVVVGTRRGEVVVLDKTTGRTEGVGEFGQSVEGALAVSPDGGVVFVPTAEADGGVEAFDVRRGRSVWRWRGAGVQAGVALADGAVVAARVDGAVVALDAETGEVRWDAPATAGAQVHAAPLAAGADVLLADDRGGVVRRSAATGAERWRTDVGASVEASLAVRDGALFVSTLAGTVHALDAATGAERWRTQPDAEVRASAAAPHGDALAVGFTDGTVRLLDAATGAERWRYRTDGNVTAPPLWLGAHVAVGTHDERLVLLDAADGAEVWSTQLRGRVKSALAVGGGVLVVLSEPRHVVAFQTAP